MGGADANTLTDGNIGVNNVDGKLKVQLNKDVDLSDTGSVTIGGIKLANQSIANTKGTSETGNYLTGLANKTWNPDTNGYVSGRAATEDQLKSVSDVASAHTKVAAGNHVTVNESTDSSTGVKTYTVNADLTGLGGMDSFKVQGNSDAASEVKISDGKIVDFKDSDNLAASISKKSDDTGVEVTYDLKDDINIGKAGADGKDGTIGVNGKDGSAVVINGKDGSIGLNGKDGANGLTIKGADGKPGLDGKDGVTRLIYETKDGETIVTHEVATLDDGMKYAGDFGDTSKVKLNKQVNVKGNAENEADLTDKNIGVVSSQDGDDGQLLIKLNKDIDLTEAGSVKIGNTDINNDGLTIHNTDTSKNITIKNGDISMGGNTITHVDAGVNDTDAVNVSQLNDVKTLAGKHTEVTVEGGTAAGTGKDDSGKDIYAGENLKLHVTDTDGLKTYDLKLADAINIGGKDGKDGHIGVNGKDGKDGVDGKDAVAIDGKDGNEGHIGLKGKDGENGTDGKDAYSDISTHYGPVTLNPEKNVTLTNGTTAATRIHYTDQDGKTHEVATMDDGQVYAGDNGQSDSTKVIKKYLNEQLDIVGGANKDNLTENNIGVNNVDGKLKVQLNKDVDLSDTGSVTIGGIKLANQSIANTKGTSETGNYLTGLANKTWNPDTNGYVSGRAATEDQLKSVSDVASAHTKVAAGNHVTVNESTDSSTGVKTYTVNADLTGLGGMDSFKVQGNSDAASEVKISDGKIVDFKDSDNLAASISKKSDDTGVEVTYDLKDDINIGKAGADGKDGTIGVNGKDGSAVVINGKDGSIGLNGKDGANGLTIKGDKGTPGLDGKDGVTRLIYETKDGETIVTHEVATLDDGMKFGANAPAAGSTDNPVSNKLNSTVNIVGSTAKEDHEYTSDNLTTTVSKDADGNTTINVLMDKDITGNSVTVGEKGADGKDGKDGTIGVNGKDGSAVVINGKDGSIGLNGKDGANGLTIKGADGKPGLDGKDGVTRLIYETKDGETIVTHEVATLDDGMKYAGDFGDTSKVKLNKQVNVKGNAENEADLTDKNIGVVSSQDGDDGQLLIKLNKDIDLTEAGSVKIGNTDINNEGLTIHNTDTSKNITIKNGDISMGGNTITHVDAGVNDTDAVNVSQLNDVKTLAGKHTEVTVEGGTAAGTGKDDSGKDIYAGENLKLHVTDTDGLKTYDLKLADAINIGGKDGQDGHIGVNGKDGSAVVINGKDGSIGLNGKDGANGLTIKGADGKPGLDGKDGVTRLIYETKDGETIVTHEVATLDDGMKYAGDFGDTSKVKLNKQVNVKGNAENEADLTDKNIGVVSSQDGDDGQLLIKLNKDIDLTEAGSVKIGNTDINNDGLTIHNTDTSKNITIKNGDISMGGNTITHVDAGVNDTDAVNVSQLNDVKTLAGKHTEVTVEGGTAAESGTDADGKALYAGENLKLHVTDTDGLKTYDLKLADAINIGGKDGKDGHIGVNGKDGKDGVDGKDAVAIDGKDGNEGHIGLKGKDGENGTDGKDAYSDISTHYGPVTLNPEKNVTLTNGTTAATRIHYTDQDGKTHEVATMDDGQVYAGDNGQSDSTKVIKKYLNEQLDIVGGANKDNLTENNIGVNNVDGKLKVQLNKDVDLTDTGSVTIGGIKLANQSIANTKGTSETGNYLIGLANKTWNPDTNGYVSGRAATEDQLKMVQDSITNVEQGGGFGLKAEDNQTVMKNLGQTITVKGDGKNIETKVANGDVQIALKRDINVDSVTFGDKTGIKISQEGLSLGNGTTNHQITNMASGANDKDSEGNPVYDVDTNGANIGDVKNIANSVAEGVKAKSGKNITVDSNNQVNLNDHIVMGDGNGTVGSGDAAKQVEIAGSEASLRAGSGDNKVSIDGKSGTLDVGDNDNGLVTVGGDSGVKLGKQTIANHDASEPNAAEGKYLTGLENTKWDRDHIVSGRAATEDQLKEVDRKVNGGRVFKGDDGQEVTVGLGETMNLKGGADSTKLTDNNIGVVKDGDNGVAIKLSKDISGLNSITINNVDNTRHVTIQGDHIDMGGNKITNVQDGEISSTSKDAVNGSQLYQTNLAVNNIGHAVNELDNRVDRVGAGAAALAALHPLDFDPDEKWDFAAGYGNYRGADAVAVGAYYRPNEDTMFSVGGSFGGGENMVNAGVSFKIGQGNHVSTSRVAMAKEIKDLRKELENLKSAMVDAAAHREIDTSKLQLFPDVPANHWAYEYVATLAGNGIVEGYPDGNFSGDRPMTRYEFAAMLYRAMLKGAVLSDRILNEFAPELERFRVDTIYKDKNGNPTVERVRVIKRNQQTK